MEIKKIASNSLNFVIKSIIQMAGLFILLIGLFLLTSLLSYSPEDPNFIFPKNTEIQNLLGFKGSVTADLFFQSLGLISILLVFNLLSWGFTLINKKVINNFFRKKFSHTEICSQIVFFLKSFEFFSVSFPGVHLYSI